MLVAENFHSMVIARRKQYDGCQKDLIDHNQDINFTDLAI